MVSVLHISILHYSWVKNIALLFAFGAHEYTVLFNQYSIENAKLNKLITYDINYLDLT